jgi:hypothetical protein
MKRSPMRVLRGAAMAFALIIATALLWPYAQGFYLVSKYRNLRTRSDVCEIGAAMARLTSCVKGRRTLTENDPLFPGELKRIGAQRVFVDSENKVASVSFGTGFYSFGYAVQATEVPGEFRLRCWSDTDDEPPSWTIKP